MKKVYNYNYDYIFIDVPFSTALVFVKALDRYKNTIELKTSFYEFYLKILNLFNINVFCVLCVFI